MNSGTRGRYEHGEKDRLIRDVEGWLGGREAKGERQHGAARHKGL